MTERTEHITINGKYSIEIERVGSAKGVLGFKVRANGDDIEAVLQDVAKLKAGAESQTASAPETPAA